MNLEDLWGQIEEDYSWRVSEIRFLENQLARYKTESNKAKLRRPIVLMLYAHFEGFCKFCFSLYVETINQSNIYCAEANSSIIAASLSNVFKQLRNPDKKSPVFRSLLPDDGKLHSFARDREFIELSYQLLKQIVEIPNNFIDMEDNLKPVVLRKILFQLGFSAELFKEKEGSITILLKYRNGIAHGELKHGINLKEYELVKRASKAVMDGIRLLIMDALRRKAFMKEDDEGYAIFEQQVASC